MSYKRILPISKHLWNIFLENDLNTRYVFFSPQKCLIFFRDKTNWSSDETGKEERARNLTKASTVVAQRKKNDNSKE